MPCKRSKKRVREKTKLKTCKSSQSQKQKNARQNDHLRLRQIILPFSGQITIHKNESAILKATDLSQDDCLTQNKRIYFVSGTSYSATRNQTSKPDNTIKAVSQPATAIVYRAPKETEWTVTAFSVSPRGANLQVQTGMAGISSALELAIASIEKPKSWASRSKVIIVTDCRETVYELKRLRDITYTENQVETCTRTREVMTLSQNLFCLGVLLEILLVPYFAPIPGYCLAVAAAQRKARYDVKFSSNDITRLIVFDEDTVDSDSAIAGQKIPSACPGRIIVSNLLKTGYQRHEKKMSPRKVRGLESRREQRW